MDIENRKGPAQESSPRTLQRAGAFASLLITPALLGAQWIYLTGDIHSASGVIAYSIADLLMGPVFAAALVTAVAALREHIGVRALRRMQMAQWVSVLAAGAFVLMACLRAANRGYHLRFPEQGLESNQTILVAWTTLVAGVNGAAWHFLGWMLVLVASAAWTSRLLPRGLSLLYVAAGVVSLFVYLVPDQEGLAALLLVIASVWQGILFWRAARA